MNSFNSSSLAFNYTEWRNKFIQSLLRLASLGGIALIMAIYQSAPVYDRVIYTVIYIFIVLVTVLPVPYELRSYTLSFMTFAVGANTILSWGPWSDGTLFLLISIILASLLIDRRFDIFLLILSAAGITIISILEQAGMFHLFSTDAHPISLQNWIVYGADFVIASLVLIIAARQFRNAFAKSNEEMVFAVEKLEDQKAKLEVQVSERTEELDNRTKQLRTTTNIARTVAEMQDIDELLRSVTDLVTKEFGHYHVGLYILDERKQSAFFQSSSSDAGKHLVGLIFQIEPSSRSAFHTVVEKNKFVILSDVESDYYFQDDNFPITRSRLILPLTVRGNVLGLLDLHSDQPLAFTNEDAETLQHLADLVSITYDNIRLLNHTKSLITQLERTTSVQINQVWTKLTSRQRPSYQYTPAGVRPVYNKADQKDEDKLKIPLVLQGQKIGTIKLRRQGTKEKWSQKEIDLLKKIAEQVALAVENSRLVEDAQKNAQRDQMLANISTRIRETLDIEAVAKTAATELRRIFDLKEAEISIGLPDTETSRSRKQQELGS